MPGAKFLAPSQGSLGTPLSVYPPTPKIKTSCIYFIFVFFYPPADFLRFGLHFFHWDGLLGVLVGIFLFWEGVLGLICIWDGVFGA